MLQAKYEQVMGKKTLTPQPSRKTKLMFFVTEDWYFVSHRLALAKAAIAAGFDVALITRTGSHEKEIRDAGIRLYPFEIDRSGLNPLREITTLHKLYRIYKIEKPDIVHHVALKPVIYGSLIAKLVQTKGVVNALTGLGSVFSSNAPLSRLLRPLVLGMFKVALSGKNQRLILQNHDDADLFAKKKIVEPGLIRLIRGSGVNTGAFCAIDEPPSLPPLVVLPARMLRDKGICEFVEAARMLHKKNVKARFVLVGKPDKQNPSSISPEQLAKWHEEKVVEYWGWHADMAAIFQDAHIACLPSYREGLPKSLLEAAACERPIVATDVPGCREIVIDGKNGWLVPKGDAAALAAALEDAITNPDKRKAYGKAGRELVLSSMSEEKVISETLSVYREL